MVKILFACIENACRSQMSEGFARHYGDKNMQVSSGGSKPAGKVNEKAIQVMEEKEIDISSQNPNEITPEKAKSSDYVITMGCGPEACPAPIGGKHIEWNIEDPSGKSIKKFREVRDKLEEKVLNLICKLKDEKNSKN